MSMSMHVEGYKQADEKWEKMIAIWDACTEAGVKVPPEIYAYFNDCYPGDAPGMTVDIDNACSEYADESSQGFSIDLTKIPADVKVIRVVNTW